MNRKSLEQYEGRRLEKMELHDHMSNDADAVSEEESGD